MFLSHYQSYLFSLRKDAVQKLIDRVSDPNLKIITQSDVINNFEKMKNKEGLVEIKFNFILPAFRL